MSEIIKRQTEVIYNHTYKYYEGILKRYHEEKTITVSTREFDANKFFEIDGVNDETTYIGKRYKLLDQETNIILRYAKDMKIYINVYHKTKEEKMIVKCINRIYSMIKFFGENSRIYDEMEIDILLYDAPRIMSGCYKETSNEINYIGDKHYFNCACGFVRRRDSRFYMIVTRRNGCLGLLTHELCHICEMDLSENNMGDYVFSDRRFLMWGRYAKKNFDINTTCKLGNMTEGINNGNSSIIHAMFCAIESGKDVSTAYKKYLLDEISHAYEMARKLLGWFKYGDLNELLNIRKRTYTQKSQLFEYIIMRCVYLLGYSDLECFYRKRVNERKYFESFMEKMKELSRIIDGIKRCNSVIRMEYYHEI